jgi:transcription termination/antitermination protein NusA
MAVVSNDSSIDPVGACVGMRGSRVQAVVAELQGEKIDIIQWSPDEATFIVNGLAPAEVSKVVMDEEDERVEVVVPDEQLSLAIGRRGQNVRLASQLTGWQIDIMTESQESERRQREFAERTALFQEALDVDEVIAQLLVTEGFASVEDVAYVDSSEVAAIEGFDEDTADEIQTRAREYLEKEAAEYDAKRKALGVEDALLEIEGVTLPMSVALGEGDVKNVEDLAGLIPDDLRGWFETRDGERVREPGILESFNLDPAEAEALIMRARIAMGWVEAPEPEPELEPEAEFAEGEYEPEAEAGAEETVATEEEGPEA